MRRLIVIIWTFFRYRLDVLIPEQILPWPVRWLNRVAPWQLISTKSKPSAERFRLALEELGPIFIKMGQMLSTRKDLLPAEFIQELAKLQDDVPPFDEDQAAEIIEKSLKQTIDDTFSEFSKTPLASASVAQVHAAILKDGKNVVVKVVRPSIKSIVDKDIRMMEKLAAFFHKTLPELRRVRLPEVILEYKHVIYGELDLRLEAANACLLRRNFIDSDLLYVPEVYFEFCSENVMVSEQIYGIPITNIEQLRAADTNMRELSERGVEIFFTQVFRDSFFHADMHPGNIFIDVSNPEKPSYIGIDCAIIGTLNDFDQYYLARNLLAIFNRDYRQVAQLHLESGWVGKNTSATEFEATIRKLCEPIFERPFSQVSFGEILISLLQTARRFDMEIQPSLVLLQKTLLHIEGLGRQLYPELDLWTTAKPFLEKWLKERYSPSGLISRFKQLSPSILEQLPRLPETIMELPNQQRQFNKTTLEQEQQLLAIRKDLAQSKLALRLTVLVLSSLAFAYFVTQ